MAALLVYKYINLKTPSGFHTYVRRQATSVPQRNVKDYVL